MPFTETLARWEAAGIEPPDSLKTGGWQAGMKPPDAYFNWFMYNTYRALLELQKNAAHTEKLGQASGVATLDANTLVPLAQLPTATVIAKGIVQLTSATNSTSTSLAATAAAVKAAYDLAASKAGTSVATTSANGLMSSTDKAKLDGVESGANNYTHPATHPPSIIAQDSSNRFVTDAEKTAWNAKETLEGAQAKATAVQDWVKSFGIGAEAKNITGTNLNDLRYTGFFMGDQLTNAPNGSSGWFYVISLEHNVQYHKQLAFQLDNVDNRSFERVMAGGVWGSWKENENAAGAQVKADYAETNAKTYTQQNAQMHKLTDDNGRTIMLPDGTDLNQAFDTGFYLIGRPLNGAPHREGFHSGRYFYLISIKQEDSGSGHLWSNQTLIEITTGTIFTRATRGLTPGGISFTEWKEQESAAGAQDKASTAEVKAVNFAKSFGVGNASSILDGMDLNTVRDGGFYRVQNNCVNLPHPNFWGGLLVFGSIGDEVTQLALDAVTNEIHHRVRNTNAGWSTWTVSETKQGAQYRADTAETNAKNASYPRTGGDLNGNAHVKGRFLTAGPNNEFVINVNEAGDIDLSALAGDIAPHFNDEFNVYQGVPGSGILKLSVKTDGVYVPGGRLETEAGAQGKIDTAIAALIEAAPGAMDTLNELAAAMGDDPDFASTVTNALAQKAPKADFDAHNGDGVRHITTEERANWNAKETPEGAQAKANQAETNAVNWALSFGLGGNARRISGTDLNVLEGTGFFVGANLINSPTYLEYWFVEQVQWGPEDKKQTVTQLMTMEVFIRKKHGGIWGAWFKAETAAGAQNKANQAEANAKNYTKDNAQMFKLTRDDGRLKILPEGTDLNQAFDTGFYVVGQPVNGVPHREGFHGQRYFYLLSFKQEDAGSGHLWSSQTLIEITTGTTFTRTTRGLVAGVISFSEWKEQETAAGAQAKADAVRSLQVNVIPHNSKNNAAILSEFQNGISVMFTNTPLGFPDTYGTLTTFRSDVMGYQVFAQQAAATGIQFYRAFNDVTNTWEVWVKMETSDGAQEKANKAEANAKGASIQKSGDTVTGLITHETPAAIFEKVIVPDDSYRQRRYESPTKEHISFTRDASAGKALEIMLEAANGFTPKQLLLVGTDGTIKMNNGAETIESTAGAQAKVDAKAGDLATLNTSAKGNLVAAVNELFTSASNGKTEIAAAITGKGVLASSSDTFPVLANKIGQISTGKKWASGTGTATWANNYRMKLAVSGLDFTPNDIIIRGFFQSGFQNFGYVTSMVSDGYEYYLRCDLNQSVTAGGLPGHPGRFSSENPQNVILADGFNATVIYDVSGIGSANVGPKQFEWYAYE